MIPVRMTPVKLAKGILARQLSTGEARVGWEERGNSRESRVMTARDILNAIAGRGDLTPQEAAYNAVRDMAVTDHAIAVLTDNGAREFAEDSAVTIPAADPRPTVSGDDAVAGADPDDENVIDVELVEEQAEEQAEEEPEVSAHVGNFLGVLEVRLLAASRKPTPIGELRAVLDDVESEGVGYIVAGRRIDPRDVHVFVDASGNEEAVLDDLVGALNERERYQGR